MYLLGASPIALFGLPEQVKGPALWFWLLGAVVVGFGLLFALMSVPPRFRKIIVVGITFVAGLYLSLEFLLPHEGSNPVAGFANGLTRSRPDVANAALIIGSFALLLGTSNLFQLHGKAISRRSPGWGNSLAFFISFSLIFLIGVLKDHFAPRGDAPMSAFDSVLVKLFSVLFNGFVQNLDAAMFSLVAFYIVSAAYRAFRVKSAEAGFMMVTAAIVMLGLVPVGALLTNWLPHDGILASLRLERMTLWILTWPNMAVQRAIEFGLSVGYLAMSLRIWLSLERGSFFDRQL